MSEKLPNTPPEIDESNTNTNTNTHKIELRLGDIIEIDAPTNRDIHENTYFIVLLSA